MRAMLFLHWRQIRMALVPFMVASFALPLLSVQGAGLGPGVDDASLQAYQVISGFGIWLPIFPLLAAAIGITVALSAWNWDHQLNHVYALSLPVTRVEYSMMKLGAGAALALLPVLCLWIGAHVAAASITLPSGLNAYPNQLAIRFLFAALLSYSLFFALASGTVKTTGWVLGGLVAFVVVGMLASELLAPYVELAARTHLMERFFDFTLEGPGPLGVFTGNWALIDV